MVGCVFVWFTDLLVCFLVGWLLVVVVVVAVAVVVVVVVCCFGLLVSLFG